MMVIFPWREADRRTVRPVSSEYLSKIWSTGALKNLRKCSARSGSSAAAASAPGTGAGNPDGGTWPATFGVPAGAGFVAPGGAGNAGNAIALVFARAGRLGMLGSVRRLLSGRFVAAAGTILVAAAGTILVAAASSAPTGALVAPAGELVAPAVLLVAGLGAGGGAWARIGALRREKNRSAVFTILEEWILCRVTVWSSSSRRPV